MKKNVIFIAGMRIEVCCVQTVIAGSGAAGLAAAKELFLEKGFEAVSVAEIMARAGGGQGDVLPLLWQQGGADAGAGGPGLFGEQPL